jgi:hypothetical protein
MQETDLDDFTTNLVLFGYIGVLPNIQTIQSLEHFR